MPISLTCLCCSELLSSRVQDYQNARRTTKYKFIPLLQLLPILYPHPNHPGICVLNECCVGELMTFVDNSLKVNSYNPQKSIFPHIRRNQNVVVTAPVKRKRKFVLDAS